MKRILFLITATLIIAAACKRKENQEQIAAAHKITESKVAAMDSLYNLMIAQQIRTITERDSLIKVVKSESDSAYLALRNRAKGMLLRQRELIDSMGVVVQHHKELLDSIPVLESGRRQVLADQVLMKQTQEKLVKQYMDLRSSFKDLRVSVDEAVK
ncbi:hypothetical protein NF867_05635 [Solitalea sp. MAHUQ-68]|uniref:Uncharacterized protein n=1 Tax=Solitalea agri TaxID=2953739 RepID=A0A9X2JBC6_9SPHI|nr:hypothetical protein [Solitalea agri]MCO4292342.1 hypothetical protein [Solitalea agri]